MTFADCITLFRFMLSPLLLWLTPYSAAFSAVYLLCGASDMLDGFAARRTHTESEHGARLDSAADAVFAAVCLIKLLPTLTLPYWLWYWTAGIFAVKIAGVFKKRRLALPHTVANKVTGLLLFLLPISVRWIDVRCLAVPTCIAASIAAAQEVLLLKKNS